MGRGQTPVMAIRCSSEQFENRGSIVRNVTWTHICQESVTLLLGALDLRVKQECPSPSSCFLEYGKL